MKESRKQIAAQVRNEVARGYAQRVASLEEDNKQLRAKYLAAVKERGEIKEENARLKDKLAQYEDWIERMQEFCNMPEDSRQQYITKLKQEERLNTLLTGTFEPYMRLLTSIF